MRSHASCCPCLCCRCASALLPCCLCHWPSPCPCRRLQVLAEAKQQGALLPPRHPASQTVRRIGTRIAQVRWGWGGRGGAERGCLGWTRVQHEKLHMHSLVFTCCCVWGASVRLAPSLCCHVPGKPYILPHAQAVADGRAGGCYDRPQSCAIPSPSSPRFPASIPDSPPQHQSQAATDGRIGGHHNPSLPLLPPPPFNSQFTSATPIPGSHRRLRRRAPQPVPPPSLSPTFQFLIQPPNTNCRQPPTATAAGTRIT